VEKNHALNHSINAVGTKHRPITYTHTGIVYNTNNNDSDDDIITLSNDGVECADLLLSFKSCESTASFSTDAVKPSKQQTVTHTFNGTQLLIITCDR